MLRHPCILGGPQRQVRAQKPKVVPNKEVNKQKWQPHPCFFGVPKEGANATSPLHFRGSPTPNTGRKVRSVPQQRGKQTEVAASPLPSRGPKRVQKCCITPAFSGAPNAKRGVENQKWSPTKRNKIGSGCLTRCFSGAQKRAGMLPHPYILGGLQCQARGRKSEVVPNKGGQNRKWLPHPCLLRGPQRGRKCYLNPAFRGVPNAKRGDENQMWSPTKGNKIGSGCLTCSFSGAQKRAKMVRHPCILGGPQRQARAGKLELIPNKGVNKQKWLPHSSLLGGPKEGGNAISPLHARGFPTPSAGRKTRSVPQQKG